MQLHLQRKLPIGELLHQEGLLTSEQVGQGLAVQKTRRPVVPLGQLCIELGFLSATELGRVLSQHGRRLLLGELLALTGVITPAQLQEALGQQRTQGPRKKLGALLIDNGWLDEKTLMYALYQQVRLADKVVHRLFQKFDTLLSNECLTPQDLLAAIVEARERHCPVETVLMERYQISKQEIGYALTTFYQHPFVEYDDKRQLMPALLQGINPGYLKTHYWVPLQADEHSVDVLIDNPAASDKIRDIQRLFPDKTVRCMVGLREDILQYVQALSSERVQQSTPEALTTLLGQMEAAEREEQLDAVEETAIDE